MKQPKHPLIDPTQGWIEVTFTEPDTGKPHKFYSGINEMSNDRLTGWDTNPPVLAHTLSEIRHIVRNIKLKATNVVITGTIKI